MAVLALVLTGRSRRCTACPTDRAVVPNAVQRHHPYSPKCVEGVFSEVRITPVQPLGHPRLRSVALAEEFDTLEPKVLAALERVKEASKVRSCVSDEVGA